jgi:hypothetical protein
MYKDSRDIQMTKKNEYAYRVLIGKSAIEWDNRIQPQYLIIAVL